MTSSIYGRLFKYRAREARSPLEDFLTEGLVDLILRMPIEVLGDFLDEITNQSAVWAECIRKRRVTCTSQVSCDGGFADIVVYVDARPAVVIENKLYSPIRAHGNGDQLTTYGRWLARVRDPELPSALVLLTAGTSAPPSFQGAGNYGVERRTVIGWAKLAGWLLRKSADDAEVWAMLAQELVGFLGECGMTKDTIKSSDVAAAHLFLPSWSRWKNTFNAMWDATGDLREGLLSQKLSPLGLDGDGGILWQWCYSVSPMPRSSWIAIGLRFPDASVWYRDAKLPSHPHLMLIVGADNEKLPVNRVRTLAEGWSMQGAELITARSLHDFSGSTEGQMADLASWARLRMSQAGEMLRLMV